MKRTGVSALALPATALVGSLWLVVACALGSPVSPQPIESVGQTPRLAPLVSKEPIPTPTVPSPTLAATAEPTLHPSPPTTPEQPSPTPTAAVERSPDEPVGSLTAGQSDGVTGWEGSYCWQDVCADLPGLPDTSDLPLLVAVATDQLTFAIDPVAGVFYDWHVDYSAGGGKPKPLASGDPFDPDSDATDPPMRQYVSFDAPPAGDWTVTVSIRFVEGGDAMYAWHVVVR